jgi:uncharacterized repeat protein (TIGR01451 family)
MKVAPLPLLCSFLILAATAPLLAADSTPTAAPPRLEVTVDVQREVTKVDASGRAQVVLEPVKAAHPGDVLVYSLRATNVGLAPARQAQIEDPIPAGTVLLSESLPAQAKNVRASVDGGKTWQSFPATVTVRRDDGQVERVPAPADAYTHLRWVLEGSLPPGESAEVGFKVKVQ